MSSIDHAFGGPWTQAKLSALRNYLVAYQQALKNQRFRTAYIDAFAGTGYRTPRATVDAAQPVLDFEEFRTDEVVGFLDGSARIALKVEPPFDSYIFIEKDAEHVACLRQLEREFPDLASRMSVLHGDANEELERLCASSWHTPGRQCRAVLFLDPYGMSVRWSTIEAIARTQAIDLWYFFPLGVAVNRLLRRDGAIPEEWGRRLTDTFGTDTWRGAFYSRRTNLFGEEAITKTADIGRIRDFLLDRLRTIFPAVASNPQMLRNSTGNPLYLLCFAAANERGGRVALRIAEHILKHLRAEGRTHDAGS